MVPIPVSVNKMNTPPEKTCIWEDKLSVKIMIMIVMIIVIIVITIIVIIIKLVRIINT